MLTDVGALPHEEVRRMKAGQVLILIAALFVIGSGLVVAFWEIVDGWIRRFKRWRRK